MREDEALRALAHHLDRLLADPELSAETRAGLSAWAAGLRHYLRARGIAWDVRLPEPDEPLDERREQIESWRRGEPPEGGERR